MTTTVQPMLTAGHWDDIAFAMRNQLGQVIHDRRVLENSFPPYLHSEVMDFFNRLKPFLLAGIPVESTVDEQYFRLAVYIVSNSRNVDEQVRNVSARSLLTRYIEFLENVKEVKAPMSLKKHDVEVALGLWRFFEKLHEMSDADLHGRAAGLPELDRESLAIAG